MNKINFVKMAIFDLDGTLTDGVYIVGSHGEVSKSFNTKDFHGLAKLQANGICVLIITGSNDFCIDKEIERLPKSAKSNLILEVGVDDKKAVIQHILDANCLTWDCVTYMGDDENDLESMKLAAFTACPNDAVQCIKDESNYISDKLGGHGAVRDFVEFILDPLGKLRENN